jgi:hypothetical protein
LFFISFHKNGISPSLLIVAALEHADADNSNKSSYIDATASLSNPVSSSSASLPMQVTQVRNHWLIPSFTESIPFLNVKKLGSSACLEARENVLLLVLLPVFDTGLFIAIIYLPYSSWVGYLSVRI